MEPSRAAIIFPENQSIRILSWLDETLRSKRYKPWSDPIPSGYLLRPLEWLGFVITRSDHHQWGVLVQKDVSQIFQLALWLSTQYPDLQFLAWRRLRGLEGVLKYYAKGQPQLKVGDDNDLELTWHVPTTLPVNVPSPTDVGLTIDPTELEDCCGTALRPYDSQIQQPVASATRASYIRRDSVLVQMY